MPEALLVQLPFAPVRSPSMALSALKGALTEGDVSAEVFYSNLIFRRKVFARLYDEILSAETALMLPELVFAPFAFPDETGRHRLAYEKYRRSRPDPKATKRTRRRGPRSHPAMD